MRRILFYMPSLAYGGVLTVSEILSQLFFSIGYDIYWLIGGRSEQERNVRFPKERIFYLPANELFAADNIRFIDEFVETKSIDYIINQDGLYEGAQLIANTKVAAPMSISVIHSNPFLNYDHLWSDICFLRNRTLLEKFKRIARIVLYPKIKRSLWLSIQQKFIFLKQSKSHLNLLSEAYVEQLCRLDKTYNGECSAISNPNTYAEVSDIDNKENIVLFVGRLDNRSKKVNYLIDIWKNIAKRNPDWKLLIVGDGMDADLIKKKASGISSIVFEGYRDPTPYYRKASILCMTSIFEGFPMCMTEAMQHGCVPMAFDSFPAVNDLIINSYNGYIIKSFSRVDYAAKLEELMNDHTLRKTMSCNAIKHVARYNQDEILVKWVNLFDRLDAKHL